MKNHYILIIFVYSAISGIHAKHRFAGAQLCVNMWDEGCINGQLPGSGGDDDYLNGGFNPGKRCVNVWDEGCIYGQLNAAGGDDSYLQGGFNPGKRELQAWLLQNSKMHKSKSHQ